jgi:sensor domain CHASE-containing protein
MKINDITHKFLVLFFCLLFSMATLGLGELWIKIDMNHEESILHDSLLLNGALISQEIQKNIYSAVYATNTLETLLFSGELTYTNFDYWGSQIVSRNHAASTIQFAPDGIVKYIYPLENNQKAIGHDLLKDDSRNDGARKAITSKELTFVGPVKLIQNDKYAVIARNPIFINNDEGEIFWGFAIAIMLLEDIISEQMFQENSKSIYYQLLGNDPDSESPPVLYSTENFNNKDSLILDIKVPNGSWVLKMNHEPIYNSYYMLLRAVLIVVSLLISIFIYFQQLKIKDRSEKIIKLNEKLTKISMIDELTGVGNRRSGIKILENCVKQANRYKYKLCIFMIDVDYFKNVNDT